MGSLKAYCGSSYCSSIETIIALFLRKSRFCVHVLATDRQTDGQHHRIKPFTSSNLISGSYEVQNA